MTALVDRARALAPDIRAASSEMDTLRRLPDHLARRFREAGLYRLCIPRAYDGLEVTPKRSWKRSRRSARQTPPPHGA